MILAPQPNASLPAQQARSETHFKEEVNHEEADEEVAGMTYDPYIVGAGNDFQDQNVEDDEQWVVSAAEAVGSEVFVQGRGFSSDEGAYAEGAIEQHVYEGALAAVKFDGEEASQDYEEGEEEEVPGEDTDWLYSADQVEIDAGEVAMQGDSEEIACKDEEVDEEGLEELLLEAAGEAANRLHFEDHTEKRGVQQSGGWVQGVAGEGYGPGAGERLGDADILDKAPLVATPQTKLLLPSRPPRSNPTLLRAKSQAKRGPGTSNLSWTSSDSAAKGGLGKGCSTAGVDGRFSSAKGGPALAPCGFRKGKLMLRIRAQSDVDAYSVLGVPRTATRAVIEHSYRKACVVVHPDKVSGRAEEFNRITQAKDLLLDPLQRRALDLKLAAVGCQDTNPPAARQANMSLAQDRPSKTQPAEMQVWSGKGKAVLGMGSSTMIAAGKGRPGGADLRTGTAGSSTKGKSSKDKPSGVESGKGSYAGKGALALSGERKRKTRRGAGMQVDGRQPKQALNSFLQRYHCRLLTKGEITYDTVEGEDGFRSTLVLKVPGDSGLKKLEFPSNDVHAEPKDAEKDAAHAALDYYADELKALPPTMARLKKQCRPRDLRGEDRKSSTEAEAARQAYNDHKALVPIVSDS